MTSTRETLQSVVARLAEVIDQLPADLPEDVPDIIHEWPKDDKHLRGEFWEDKDGDIYRFSDGQREEVWQPETRQWVDVLQRLDNDWAPFTRTTDPSLPRTWDTLDAVPEDVERVSGDYGGHRRELTRSGLSESGWFQRAKGGSFRGWMELSADRTKYVKNIKETQ